MYFWLSAYNRHYPKANLTYTVEMLTKNADNIKDLLTCNLYLDSWAHKSGNTNLFSYSFLFKKSISEFPKKLFML